MRDREGRNREKGKEEGMTGRKKTQDMRERERQRQKERPRYGERWLKKEKFFFSTSSIA